MSRRVPPAVVVCLALAIVGWPAAAGRARAAQTSAPASGGAASVEDIYIGRSWRESRGAPTEFCASERTGLGRASTEECLTVKQNFPEPGISVQRCFLDMDGLPPGYVGGQLTTNTIGSRRQIGEPTEPPGYTQPSIATIRLWKHR